MSSFWADACTRANSKPLQALLDAAHGSCGTTIAAYCMSALVSGVMFYRWRHVGEEARQQLWRLYGWFSGLMLCGSCVGVVTWAAWMQVAANEFTSVRDITLSFSESLLFFSVSNSWRAVFVVTYAIEFLCLSVAKLIVLDRMSDFAAGLWIWKHWAAGRRAVIACVVAGNAVGLAGNIAAAVQFHRVAQLLSAASAHYAANEIALGTEKILESQGPLQLANNITSVQAFCEVAVLLLIVVAFAVVGALCVRRISSRIAECDAADTVAKQLRRQIIGTAGVVFVTFLIRSVYSTISAVASKLQDTSNSCAGVTSFCDASCFNVFTHVFIWMQYTPEFQLMIVLISKPLPLLVALWGMTSQRLRQQMQTNETDISMQDRLLKRLARWRLDLSTQ